MSLKVGELFASFGIDTAAASAGLDGLMAKCTSMGSSLKSLGTEMTAAITLPLTLLGKKMFQNGADFEAQMSKVFAVSGLTDQTEEGAAAMSALTEKARELGSTTVWTATEAGEALVYMGMAGWKTEAMLGALTPVMNLASAAGADLGTTSDIVTDAMTAFGLTLTKARGEAGDMSDYIQNIDAAMESGDWSAFADQLGEGSGAMDVFNGYVQHFTDVLSAAAVNSNTNVTMLGESFKYIAPVAGALGYSIDDTAVALGLMANNGIKASMAGTSLRNILTRMAKPTDEAQAAMDALGLSMYNADGTVKSLGQQMSDWRAAGIAHKTEIADMAKAVAELDAAFDAGNMSETEYEARLAGVTQGSSEFLQNIVALAGMRGMSGLLAIMNTTDDDFRDLSLAIQNADGTTQTMADTMLDNVQGSMTLMNSAFEGLSTTLFDLIKEPIRGVIENITELLQKFQSLSPETQSLALKIAAIAAAAGPVMTITGSLITKLPTLIGLVGQLASPLGIAAGLLGLFFAAGKDDDNSIGDFISGISDKLNSIDWAAIGEKISGFASTLLQTIFDGMGKLAPDLGGLVAAIGNGIGNAASMLGDVAGQLIGTIINALLDPAFWGKLIDIGFQLGKGILTGLWNALAGLATGIWNAISGAFKSVFGLSDAEIQEAYGQFTELYKNTNAATADFVQQQASLADIDSSEGLRNLFEAYTIAVEDGGDEAAAEFEKYSAILEGPLSDLFRVLSGEDARIDGFTYKKSVDSNLFDVLAALDTAGVDISSFLAEENLDYEEIADWRDQYQDDIDALLEALGYGTEAGLDDAADEFAETASELPASADLAAQSLQEAMDALGVENTELTAGYTDALGNAALTMQAAVDQLGADVVKAAMESMSYTEGYAIGTQYANGIKEGFASISANVASLASGAVTSSSGADKLTTYTTAGVSIGESFGSGIVAGLNAKLGDVTAAASALGDAMIAATGGAIQVGSPSKRARDEIGKMYDFGIALGLTQNLDTVNKAASKVGESLHDQFLLGDPAASTHRSAEYAMQQAARSYGMNGSTSNYNYSDPVNIGTVNVQDKSDIDALADEITARRRRTVRGFGSR